MKKLLAAALSVLWTCSAADAQTGTWSGRLEVQGTSLSLVFHLDTDSPTMDSPDQGARGIPVLVERPGAGRIDISIPSLGARFEGVWTIRQIVGTFTQMSVSLPLTLTPGEYRPNRPQTPVGPFPYLCEEVSFANGDVILEGTLVLPEGYSRETPVLVMVTGSGQQNRDEEIFSHKPFAVIADELARNGIATLRYDDRGFGGYEGNIYECTVEDFMNDALAGIELLRDRFDKVGVLGHSEGGTIAMMLAAQKKADFIVSLAGMAVSGAETLLWQNRGALSELGFPDDVTDAYCRLLEADFVARMHDGVMPDPEDYDLPEPLVQNFRAAASQMQLPYMTRFLSLDMRQSLPDITCPVLALNGARDTQVDHLANLEALRKGLPEHPESRIESIEGLNHLFQHCTTGAASEYRDIEETIAPQVLEKIVSWLSYFK